MNNRKGLTAAERELLMIDDDLHDHRNLINVKDDSMRMTNYIKDQKY